MRCLPERRLPMAIEYIDGIRLYRTLTAGIRRVVSREEYLNKINVFPVPDSDTGTNMAFTLTTIEEKIASRVQSNIEDMSAVVADAALDGARGNSGAILAQFLVGFAEGIRGHLQIDTRQFARAVQTAKAFAYEALVSPREGTILTVLKEWANSVHHLAQRVNDFAEILATALDRARQALEDTPKQLEVLAQAGVVDAGARGFVDLLEGIQDYIERGVLLAASEPRIRDQEQKGAEPEGEYRYCTECLILGNAINRPELQAHLNELGNSIVIAGTKTKAKVHLHTNDPARAFDTCRAYGTVTGEKVDDMHQQQADAHDARHSIALVVDSTSDLPEEYIDRYRIHQVPVRLSFGDKHYVDKVTLTIDEFWSELRTNPHHPKTSQPTPGDFRRQYQFLATHYDSALSIHLPQKLSGTYQSAQTASASLPEFPIGLVDANTLSVGIGLVVLEAARAIESGASFDETMTRIQRAVKNTHIYVLLDTLEYAVRGGRVPRSKQKITSWLGLYVILTVSPEGALVPAGTLWGRRHRVKRLFRFVRDKIPAGKQVQVGIVHADCRHDGEALQELFAREMGQERTFLSTIGPALGVHAGPGALGVAFHIREDES
ncbi:MAG: DegV family EDD domain-containing protein [Candidatus Neomarinimicrobiota bacterium]|nr:MAG: DegV family EDD domain-containing protein [Candidatus Neomarinimicrobiota bacterium]